MLGPLKDLSVDALLMSAPKDEGVLIGDVRPANCPPGRGMLVSRTRHGMVQIASCHRCRRVPPPAATA